MTTGTFCQPCWVQFQPDNDRRWAAHESFTCRDQWTEASGLHVCMCGCSDRARADRTGRYAVLEVSDRDHGT